MNRGRIIFWCIAGTLIAAAGGAVLYVRWLGNQPSTVPPIQDLQKLLAAARARADEPPEPWTPPSPWWKAQTIDAFDRQHKPSAWPCARRAVVAFGADLARGAAITGDEPADAMAAAATAMEHGCEEPLVTFVWSRYRLRNGIDPKASATIISSAAKLRQDKAYPSFIRILATYEAAPYVSRRTTQSNESIVGTLDAADLLWSELAADPNLPPNAIKLLSESMEKTFDKLRMDGKPRVEALVAALEQAGRHKSLILTTRGLFSMRYAWNARGGGFASTVTESGWRGFKEHLQAARVELTEAWEADPTNSVAAEAMITVCMGDNSDRPEMEKWFKRAIDADPSNYQACSRKMLYLEPKWGGSVPSMILFGRELLRVPDEPATCRNPLLLVDTHWELAEAMGDGGISPAYFADNHDAWTDISTASERYLKHVPTSRRHRTRYALIAGWSGKWDVCRRQFDMLGQKADTSVMPANLIAAMRERAAMETASQPREQ